jgi:hypothetical protein
MTSIKAETMHGGKDIVATSEKPVMLLDYQYVTSHGNEAVTDAEKPTSVAHYPGKAVLKCASSTKTKGRVHLPIHNPPQVVGQVQALKNIAVCFQATDATIQTVTLYYDTKLITQIDCSRPTTFNAEYTPKESIEYAYVITSGISVMLDLKFENSDAVVNLYSVTLAYQATELPLKGVSHIRSCVPGKIGIELIVAQT